MSIQFDFSGKTVLITGATRGIGAAIALGFCELGANLILTGTISEEIERLNSINQHRGIGNIQYHQLDCSDDISLQSFLEKISSYKRIDVCVNNAGINRINPIYATETNEYDLLTGVNLRAPFLICRQVSQLMKNVNYGRIVNIASIWSVISKAKRSIYSITKAGLVGMTRGIAVDLAPYNVLANAVSPGFTLTELTESTLTKKDIQELSCQVPVKRFALPEEISRVVLFLASDLNTYITGQNIVVDGGFASV